MPEAVWAAQHPQPRKPRRRWLSLFHDFSREPVSRCFILPLLQERPPATTLKHRSRGARSAPRREKGDDPDAKAPTRALTIDTEGTTMSIIALGLTTLCGAALLDPRRH